MQEGNSVQQDFLAELKAHQTNRSRPKPERSRGATTVSGVKRPEACITEDSPRNKYLGSITRNGWDRRAVKIQNRRYGLCVGACPLCSLALFEHDETECPRCAMDITQEVIDGKLRVANHSLSIQAS